MRQQKPVDHRSCFGKNMTLLRRQLGLSQERMAAHLSERTGLDIPRSTIGGYEETRFEPQVRILALIAKALKVSMDDLYNVDLTAKK